MNEKIYEIDNKKYVVESIYGQEDTNKIYDILCEIILSNL